MSYKKKLIYLFIIYSVLSPQSSLLVAKESAGTSGATSLLIPVGVRSMGMGDVGVALVSGANGIHYNPASLAHVNRVEVSFSQHSTLLDTSLGYVAFGKPLGFRGFNELGGTVLGGDVLYADKGKIEVNTLRSDGSLESSESKTAGYDLVVGLAYAEHFLKGSFGLESLEEGTHSLGLIVKGIQSNLLGAYNARAVALDLGYLGKLKNFSVGLSLSNIGSRLKFIDVGDALPVTLRAGFAYGWNQDLYRGLVAADVLFQEDNFKSRVGFEVGLLKTIALRAGWHFEPANLLSGPTFGFGYDQGQLFVDYAISWYGDLKDTQRLSLGIRFGANR